MKFMPQHQWLYQARIINVVDGDTIDVVIDRGLRETRVERLRLLGVNTPERKKPTLLEGNTARGYVIDWFTEAETGPFFTQQDWPLLIETYKDDAFGRWLAVVWRKIDGACLNDNLIRDGMAVEDIRK